MSAIALHGAPATPLPTPSAFVTALFALIILAVNVAIISFAAFVLTKPDHTDDMGPHSPYYEWPTPGPDDADAS